MIKVFSLINNNLIFFYKSLFRAPNLLSNEKNNLSYNELLKIILVSFILTLIRLFCFYGTPLHPDEAYYWVWSRRLEFSYYDINPAIAYYIRIFTTLFGDTYFALKLATSYLSFLITIFSYLCARTVSLTIKQSYIIIIAMSVLPPFFIGSIMLVPDNLLILFWIIFLYFTLRYIRTKENFILYLCGLSLGVGILSKQTMLASVIGLAFWYLLNYKDYPIYKNKHFWLSGLVALIFLIPIFIWNYNNDWGQYYAMKFHRPSIGRSKPKILEFFLGQAATIGPFWYFLFLFLLLNNFYKAIISIYKKIKERDFNKKSFSEKNFNKESNIDNKIIKSQWQWVWINAIVFHVIFLSISNNRHILANWLFPSYLAIFMLLVASYFENFKKLFNFNKIILYLGFIVAVVANLYVIQTKESFAKIGINISPQLIIKNLTRGYDKIVYEVNEKRKKLDPNAGLLSLTYQDAALASWYLPNHEYVHSLSILTRSQYSYWEGPKLNKNYFIYISLKTRIENFFIDEFYFKQMCGSMQKLGRHYVEIDNEQLKGYELWYCKNYLQDWYPIYDKYYQNQIYRIIPGLSDIILTPHTKDEINYTVMPFQTNNPKSITSDEEKCIHLKHNTSSFAKIKAFIKHGKLGICHEIYKNKI